MKKIKVIHLPTTVGGNPQGISKHLNEIGVKSETWAFEQNYFGYPADKIIKKSDQTFIVGELKRILALSYIFKADIIFYNYGSGMFIPFIGTNSRKDSSIKAIFFYIYSIYSRLMANFEVELCRIFNKPIFIQYQGDDARQGDFCKANFKITFASRVDDNYYNAYSDRAKRKSIEFYAKRTSKIYALNPDLLRVLPEFAEFLPYSNISLVDWTANFNQLEDRPLRIGHAPSNRAVKGTELILDALNDLKVTGFKFELVLVEGVSNIEAKEIYKTIDVLVDQLFAGWYGGLAVELMALGKPVIAYIRQDDLHFLPDQMRADLPIIQAEPNTIREVLKTILRMPRAEILEIAKRSRAYVEMWHDPIQIAQRIKADMEFALDKKI
jgi:hypothetical protein